MTKVMPILAGGDIKSIPFLMLEPHRAQAFANHSQTLERIAERGGLSPDEAVAILEDRKWTCMNAIEATNRLRRLVTTLL